MSAKKDEVNVVEVNAVDYSGESVQCPIVNLTQKGTAVRIHDLYYGYPRTKSDRQF